MIFTLSHYEHFFIDTHSGVVCKYLYCLLTFGEGGNFALILNICLLCQTRYNMGNPVIYAVLMFGNENFWLHVSNSFFFTTDYNRFVV